MISLIDIAWLAGFLEGEGSFRIMKDRRCNSLTFRIQVSSTDRDVISRAAKLLGARAYSTERSRVKRSCKILYSAAVSNKIAISWMMTIYSMMGTRRKQQIKDAIISWKSYKGYKV